MLSNPAKKEAILQIERISFNDTAIETISGLTVSLVTLRPPDVSVVLHAGEGGAFAATVQLSPSETAQVRDIVNRAWRRTFDRFSELRLSSGEGDAHD